MPFDGCLPDYGPGGPSNRKSRIIGPNTVIFWVLCGVAPSSLRLAVGSGAVWIICVILQPHWPWRNYEDDDIRLELPRDLRRSLVMTSAMAIVLLLLVLSVSLWPSVWVSLMHLDGSSPGMRLPQRTVVPTVSSMALVAQEKVEDSAR